MKRKEIHWPPRNRAMRVGIHLSLMIFSMGTMTSCSAPQHAAQEAPLPPLQYLGGWGSAGVEPGQLQNPQAFFSDSIGNVYIADNGKPPQIEKFDSSGHPLLVFDMAERGDDSDVAVDPGEAIFVVDLQQAQVQIFSPEGERFRTLSFRYRKSLNHPASIAIDSSGEFYLSDFKTGRIARMNPRGRFLQVWGRPEGLPFQNWAPCRIRLGPDGNLYIADAKNQRIEKLSSDGRYLSSWDFPFSDFELGQGPPRHYGLAVSKNFVAASDEAKHLLGIWTLDGLPKLTVDFSKHPEWGQNAAPTDVAFDPKGELLVLDRLDSRALRFRINIADGEPDSPNR